MILDLPKYLEAEGPYWDALEKQVARLEADPAARLDLAGVQRLHYLYERASGSLGRLQTYAAEPDTIAHLESLVARAYGQIHSEPRRGRAFSPLGWFAREFPRAFRRRMGAFWLASATLGLGACFGAAALLFDPGAKAVLIPFGHLSGSPHERVKEEEEGALQDRVEMKAAFSASLMTHNTKVSILSLALGMTFGAGTLVLDFYNGVILGAVAADYVREGETAFLLGWLMPHGVIEIPAVLIASQAGLVLAGALLGRRSKRHLRRRLRDAAPDLVTLVGGAACLLVWAGLVEAFVSQYHEPLLPYSLKIGLGAAEAVLLVLFLARAGRAETT